MSLVLGDTLYKNRVLKSCLEHLDVDDDRYVSSMLRYSYFHPGGVNYCVLQHKKGENYR